MSKEPKAPRQRPVSCRFCRSRKLRCSRDAPCSNCAARGISCELETASQAARIESAGISEGDALERIRQLEELVESLSSQQELQSPAQNGRISVCQIELPSSENRSSPKENLDNEIAWLESIYNGRDLTFNAPSNRVIFKTCPIKSILRMHPHISRGENLVSRCFWLPQYEEAKMLLEKYIKDIDHVHHVVHTPSLRTILDSVYARTHKNDVVRSGYDILLLAIFASSSLAWEQRDSERGLFMTPDEAHMYSPFWIKEMEDLLDIAHRTTSVSLEGIQGIIIAIFVVTNMEGFSRRCRSLWNMGLMLSRDLEVHLIDHSSKSHLAHSAQAEMGRRVWWYLVASDWMIPSFIPGTYQCHLRQMMVNKPKNLNDEEVVDGMSETERPLSLPTAMSYSLCRIRLAEISRRLADRTPLTSGHSGGPNHDVVLDIDTELQMLLNDTPAFFSMSLQELMATHQLSYSRAIIISQQGRMVRSFIHARRCELHFPFYSRGFDDPVYASSRDVCVQSARLLIQGQPIRAPYRFLGLLVGVFMASIVLVVDLCHGKSPSHKVLNQEAVAKACGILDEARHESATAAKFLDSLMQLLRKHKISPPRQPLIETPRSNTGSENVQLILDLAINNTTSTITPDVELPISGDLTTYFDDMAQSFEQGGGFDWDNMLSDLGSAFV